MDTERLICDRARAVDASGIRRIFNLAAKLQDPINLSIGQPDFPVPDRVKDAAIEAIRTDRNGYTLTKGIGPLLDRIAAHLRFDIGWDVPGDDGLDCIVTSGTAGALTLLFLALIGPGDEAIIPDPYFAMYPYLATIAGGKAVRCEMYPDGRMTAERVEPLISERTKLVLFNSPNNPTGVVSTVDECKDLLELCRSKGILLVSDEIYDEFTFAGGVTDVAAGDGVSPRCPSPARLPGAEKDVLLIRGFGKTYGCTGWRGGYAVGPTPIIDAITRLQQYTFVCAPSPTQWGVLAAFDVDMTQHVADFQRRRDMVIERLQSVTEVAVPEGAFYAFPKVPEHLGLTGTEFVDRCIEQNVMIIPGNVFSGRDTHVRLSYAAPVAKIEQGLDIITKLMQG
ncbi:MAG TPA: aminotransferase class I/II-fold pyridoxal phosphate-dependent enzyme [Phycisphaerales bacterium]|nr:aminotransferase class I/II-fold pyridoxal phosphate-dependent enzyme [Phycisphaerales bacterium]